MSGRYQKLDAFTRSYIEAALSTEMDESTPSGGKPLDDTYDVGAIAGDSLDAIVADCEKFQQDNAALLQQASVVGRLGVDEMAGCDFWLTRNGHGAGFWDGDWSPDDVAEALDKAAKASGRADLYVGDDGELHYDSRSSKVASSPPPKVCRKCGAVSVGGVYCPNLHGKI